MGKQLVTLAAPYSKRPPSAAQSASRVLTAAATEPGFASASWVRKRVSRSGLWPSAAWEGFEGLGEADERDEVLDGQELGGVGCLVLVDDDPCLAQHLVDVPGVARVAPTKLWCDLAVDGQDPVGVRQCGGVGQIVSDGQGLGADEGGEVAVGRPSALWQRHEGLAQQGPVAIAVGMVDLRQRRRPERDGPCGDFLGPRGDLGRAPTLELGDAPVGLQVAPAEPLRLAVEEVVRELRVVRRETTMPGVAHRRELVRLR
jgi:hypothetical protein